MWSGNKAATRSDEMEENWNVELDDGDVDADADADAQSSSTSEDMSLTQLKKKTLKHPSAQKKVTKKVTKKRRAGVTTQDERAVKKKKASGDDEDPTSSASADGPICLGYTGRKGARDMIDKALAGDLTEVQDYIKKFPRGQLEPVHLTKAAWAEDLPAWKGQDADRGLKAWSSKTARGGWNIAGICAKVVNRAVGMYMETFAVPPVVEGIRVAGAPKSPLTAKSKGLDHFTPFLLIVHRAYCKYLNPAVEEGLMAFTRVSAGIANMTRLAKLHVPYMHSSLERTYRYFNTCLRGRCG